jgi:hypothetical protein
MDKINQEILELRKNILTAKQIEIQDKEKQSQKEKDNQYIKCLEIVIKIMQTDNFKSNIANSSIYTLYPYECKTIFGNSISLSEFRHSDIIDAINNYFQSQSDRTITYKISYDRAHEHFDRDTPENIKITATFNCKL